jgi:hypothetical protein
LLFHSSVSLSDSEEPKRRELCEFLLSKGADKDITNKHGLTAYDIFRKARRSIQDHEATFGLRSVPRYLTTYQTKDRLANELELVPMPTRSPSPAGESVDEENSNDEFDADNDDDDDDDDDIEEEGEDEDQDVEGGDDDDVDVDVDVDEEGEEL